MKKPRGPGAASIAPLPFSPRPVPGENLHGYLRRLSVANGHVNITTFFGAIGLHAFSPRSSDSQWERLRAQTELPREAFGTMRWPASSLPTGLRISFLKRQVAPAHVHSNSMRFCPECLRSNAIRRDFWSLRMVVACPVHATFLADTCPECGERFRPQLGGRPDTCLCGLPYANLPASPATPAAILVSRNLAAMFGPRLAVGVPDRSWRIDLAAPFRGIGPFDYLTYLDVIGVAGSTSETNDHLRRGSRGVSMAPQPSVSRVRTVIEAAHAIISDWPSAFTSLLKALDGRGGPLSQECTTEEAFGTVVGQSLLHPPRQEDGLPLTLITTAFDAYWKREHGGRSKRRPTIDNPIARLINPYFSIADLARAVGDPLGKQFHSRVWLRTIEMLTSDERRLAPETLADLVRIRSIDLHRAASASLPASSVQPALDGTRDPQSMVGWIHPDLIQPDPRMLDLRIKGAAYSPAAVKDMLGRLKVVSQLVDKPGSLVPLVSVAMRYRARQPALTKTEVLLRIFNGTLSVYRLVDNPTMADLYVNSADLDVDVGERAKELLGPFLRAARLNGLMVARYGRQAAFSKNEFYRLAHAGLLRTEFRTSSDDGKGHRLREMYLNFDDLDGILARKFGAEPDPIIATALGHDVDIGPLIKSWDQSGLSAVAIAAELARTGFVAVRGGKLCSSVVSHALKTSDTNPVAAIYSADTGKIPQSLLDAGLVALPRALPKPVWSRKPRL